jgi:uncharacterized protein
MTAATLRPQTGGARTGRQTGIARTFRVAVLVALVHALDDALVHRGPGYGLGQHALAGVLAVVVCVGAILAFPRLRPGLKAALAFTLGVPAMVNGVMHAGHVGSGGPTGGDFTGLLALAAGVVLIGLAAAIPFVARGQGTWRARAIAVPVGLLATVTLLVPIAMGVGATHKWREAVGDPPSAGYRDVSFRASDGLDLEGWYRPSRNGAAVVVIHGGSSDRKGSVAHGRLLARHGYGVLLYDARGRGESDGSENNYGWDWAKDLAGALAFLQDRPDVDPERIGAIGLSTGADALLEVAGDRDDIAAVVTDGAAAASFRDMQRLHGTNPESVSGWLMFQTIRVLTGDSPGPVLEDQVRRIEAPMLLISAGTALEHDFNVMYERAATAQVEHWNVAQGHHTDLIHEYPGEYERRVVSFLDDALG